MTSVRSLWYTLILVSLALPVSAKPTKTDEGNREAALFGGGDDSETQSREEALFGGRPDASTDSKKATAKTAKPAIDSIASSRDMEARLQARDDTFKLGGGLYWRSTSLINEERNTDEITFRNAALIYLYGDARPNDRLRAFIKGRFDHVLSGIDENPIGQQDAINLGFNERTRARIDQLWLKFDLGRKVFFTVGQQPIRWGTGRIWNPTDFVNAQRRDPLAIFDARPGISLAKMHIPFENTGTNLYAIAQFDDVQNAHEIGGVFRVEQTMGPTEASLSVGVREDQPLRIGADFSGGLGPLELKGEYAVTHGGNRLKWTGDFDLTGTVPKLPTTQDIGDDWTSQMMASVEWGIAYGDNDTLFLTVEYFFNQDGYDDVKLYPWLITQGAFMPLYLGRHYAGLNMVLPGPGRWDDSTFILSGISNLSDKSVITRFDYQHRILTRLSVYFFAALHTGEKGEFRFEFDLPANPNLAELARNSGVPDTIASQLDNGIQVPAQWLDLGLWLSMTF